MRDIVLEQIYGKKMQSLIDFAHHQGFQKGIFDAVMVINKLKSQNIDITPKAFMDALFEETASNNSSVTQDDQGESAIVSEDKVSASEKSNPFTIVK